MNPEGEGAQAFTFRARNSRGAKTYKKINTDGICMSPCRTIFSAAIFLILLSIVSVSPASAAGSGGFTTQWSQDYWIENGKYPDITDLSHFDMSKDGNFFLAGYVFNYSAEPTYTTVAIKADKNGGMVWNRTLPADYDSNGDYVLSTDDGGCLVVRRSTTYKTMKCDVIKLDGKGNVQWDTNIPSMDNSPLKGIQSVQMAPADDGGCVVVLTIYRDVRTVYYLNPDGSEYGNGFPVSFMDIYAVKLDAGGNISWKKLITDKFTQDAKAVVKTPDGGYLITGFSSSEAGDSDNDFIRTFGFNYGGTRVHIYLEPGSSYMYTTPSFPQIDALLVKLDSNGNVMWKKTYGGNGMDMGLSILPVDNAYIVGGYGFNERLTPADDDEKKRALEDVYLLKVDTKGNKVWDKRYNINNSSLSNYNCLGVYATGQNYTLLCNNASLMNASANSELYLLTVDGTGYVSSRREYSTDGEVRQLEVSPSGEYYFLSGALATTLSKVTIGKAASPGNADGPCVCPAIGLFGLLIPCVAFGPRYLRKKK
jgi:hypothetical protein